MIITSQDDFASAVDLVALLFDLDADLPELTELKGRANKIMRGVQNPVEYLRQLNPSNRTHTHAGVIHFNGAADEYALQPWTLLRYHLGREFDFIGRVRVVNDGMYIYDVNSRLLAVFADTSFGVGNLKVACAIIKELSHGKIDLDYHRLGANITSIIAAEVDIEYFDGEDPDREWKHEIVYDESLITS